MLGEQCFFAKSGNVVDLHSPGRVWLQHSCPSEFSSWIVTPVL